MLCLFFSSIGVTTAGDFSNDENINFKNENYTNIVADGISNELSNNNNNNDINIVKSSDSTNNVDIVKSSDVSDNIGANNALVADSTTTSTVSKISNSNKVLAAAGEEKPSNLTQKQILVASNSVYKYVAKNKVLPNFVTIAGYKFSIPEFMYLLSKTIAYKYKKINSDVIVKYGVKNPSKPSGTNVKAKMSSKYYYKYANNIAKFIEKNNKAPNFVSTSWGKLQYQSIINEFSKLLRWSNLHNSELPKHISVKVSKSNKINKVIPKYSVSVSSSDDSKSKFSSGILNSKYDGESLTAYLSSSKNCQSTSATIKSLAKDITKNSKTELEKATAIFTWLKGKVSYSFYYNTKKGALKTLSSKSGNCVDQTHLLIALMRSSGIAAKYVNGKATFSSGSTYGHVWAQVLIGDTWLVADTTSSKNSLGVINNWNVGTAKIYGTYSSISF